MKKVSVITINHNNAFGLEKTIDSVVRQVGADYEFIIVDGDSTDGSKNVITANKDKITNWVSEKDKGIYNAQNKGIAMAKGDYCLFLNSGDILANESVLKNVSIQLIDVDVLYGDIITINAEGIKTHLHSPKKINVYEMMISTIWHPSAFIKRELFAKFGGYNEAFKVTGDYEFFIRIVLKHNVQTKYMALAICIFDLGGISNTEEMSALQTQERKKSWQLNFSNPVIETFEENTRLLRSREYKLGKLFMRFKKPIFGKK